MKIAIIWKIFILKKLWNEYLSMKRWKGSSDNNSREKRDRQTGEKPVELTITDPGTLHAAQVVLVKGSYDGFVGSRRQGHVVVMSCVNQYLQGNCSLHGMHKLSLEKGEIQYICPQRSNALYPP